MPRDSVIRGLSLHNAPSGREIDSAAVRIDNGQSRLLLTNEQVSRGLLAVGAPGFGKTVSLLQIAEGLRESASSRDVFVFFDTKGDYKARLSADGDEVLGYGQDSTVFWNIYEDVLADGTDDDQIYDNAFEVVTSLFTDKIEHSQNRFFPQNGRDTVMGLLYSFARQGLADTNFRRRVLNNKALAEFFRQWFTPKNITQELGKFSRTKSIVTSFSNGDPNAPVMTPQSQGVLSEAAEVGREIFKGSFAKIGDFSIRRFVRSKGARALFVEYDMALGNTLLPVYRVLCDMVLKEALSRGCNADGGRVYVFMDELRLVPNLAYLENAINFGRGMGLSVFAGIQNSSQITQVYGEDAMKSILDNFGTALIFNTSNGDTRRLLGERIGKHVRLESSANMRGQLNETRTVSNVIEDWDITSLDKGQCIVHTIGSDPFRFRFPDR